MSLLPLIEAKRDGNKLSAEQIQDLIKAYTAGRIPDYQVAALLMAIYFHGMDAEETRALTLAMRDSGDLLEFPPDSRPLADKHSTGGVGDKVSLPLAPLLACLGFRVPMISGRGLGITGGTLDKLDSIPGFRTSLPAAKIIEVVQKIGCVICGQTEKMVPADRGLYSLRDVTGTVPSIPLIVSSILSKKLAESLDALILDVKFGRAAFMPTRAEARKLAKAMVKLGQQCGVNTSALLSRMDCPLGHSAGNWLEVKETASFLAGESRAEALQEIVAACAAKLLQQAGQARSATEAKRKVHAVLSSPKPLARWEQMLEAQGTDLDAYHAKLARDSTAAETIEVKASVAGYITRCDARLLGELIRDMGGGRLTKDSKLNYDVGLDQLARPGTRVRAGAVLARVHFDSLSNPSELRARVAEAFSISLRKPPLTPLIEETID